MSLSCSMNSIRCALCRKGLLKVYEVYTLTYGQFGLPGEPVLCGHTRGYFYPKNSRHYGEVLEIAGDLPEKSGHGFRLLAFDDNAFYGSLIMINGIFYRVEYVRETVPPCRILDLEVCRIAASH